LTAIKRAPKPVQAAAASAKEVATSTTATQVCPRGANPAPQPTEVVRAEQVDPSALRENPAPHSQKNPLAVSIHCCSHGLLAQSSMPLNY